MRIWIAIRNIQGPEAIALFGFVSVAVMSAVQGYPYMALVVGAIGAIFIIVAAYNSYRHRSTELIDKYEERFFVRMKIERKYAAKYLLKEHEHSDELQLVLDYLEAPIADKMFSKILMEKHVFEYFRHWIIMYYLASKEFIENYYINDDAGSWAHLKPLYRKMIELKKHQYKIEFERECTEEDVIPNEEQLIRYLQQEARLKLSSD